LELLHFLDQDGMTEMNVWSRGIKTRLDAQRALPSELGDELFFGKNLGGAALDDLELRC
jgi:hypothetical protein